jgi:hypothetical protein
VESASIVSRDFPIGEQHMDELIKLITSKTGVSPEQAKVAAQTTLDFLKDKLPPTVAAQIDPLLSGKGMPDDLGATLGGLFGKK